MILCCTTKQHISSYPTYLISYRRQRVSMLYVDSCLSFISAIKFNSSDLLEICVLFTGRKQGKTIVLTLTSDKVVN